MPHISLSLYRGRSKEELNELSTVLQQALMDAAGWKAEDISVSVEEMDAESFLEKVKAKRETEELYIPSALIK